LITFSEAQLVSWLSPVLWPFLRVLAMFSVAPVFSQRVIPMRLKIGLAFLVAVCAQPVLGDQPVIGINSPQALGTLIQQVGVGLAVGFAVRLVFAAVEVAGEVVGLQMGLNFASFFDPTTNAQLSAVARGAALQAVGGTHGDGTRDTVTELLLNLEGQTDGIDMQRLIDLRHLAAGKLHVDDGADDLGDVTGTHSLFLIRRLGRRLRMLL